MPARWKAVPNETDFQLSVGILGLRRIECLSRFRRPWANPCAPLEAFFCLVACLPSIMPLRIGSSQAHPDLLAPKSLLPPNRLEMCARSCDLHPSPFFFLPHTTAARSRVSGGNLRARVTHRESHWPTRNLWLSCASDVSSYSTSQLVMRDWKPSQRANHDVIGIDLGRTRC